MKYIACIDPEKIIPISRSTTEIFNTGSWGSRRPRHREKVSPCRVACPAGNNVTEALLKMSQGDFNGALGAFLEESPLPGVCGRVCYHPCQASCNRGQWDGDVSIRALERAASDLGDFQPVMLTDQGKDHPVAVIGSGPAGLSAAYHLARMGHPVTIFEEEKELGGLLRWAIPRYRLPEKALDRDIERIMTLDIRLVFETPVDSALMSKLKSTYQAVFLGTGANRGIVLNIPGAGMKEVCSGLDFLGEVGKNRIHAVDGRVVVVGGGNVAIDAALTCRRLGADSVDIVCLEKREDMPAHEREIADALEEGINIRNGWGPRHIADTDGSVSGIEFMECTSVYDKEGRFDPVYRNSNSLSLDADRIILAVGQAPDHSFLQDTGLIQAAENIRVNPVNMETPVSGIYAGGDLVNRPGTVVEAIAAGKRAAIAIHLKCLGKNIKDFVDRLMLGAGPSISIHSLFFPRKGWEPGMVVRFEDIETVFLDHTIPVQLPRLDPSERCGDFREIDLSLWADEAEREAGRCFFCGTCTGCDRCFIYCPDVSIVPPEEGRGPYSVDSEHCKGCGICESVCTRGVMRMGEGI